ncbi:hypothetical protein JYB64_02105 [Algoriphagus aestuarii]|nr:hypothetical protein [Algoriphagus aestuarii]
MKSLVQFSSKQHLIKIFLLSALLFQSCSQKAEMKDPLIDFMDKENLSSIRLNSSDSLFRAGSLLVFDSMLIAKDDELEYLFKIIDIKQDLIIKQFGKIGEGPCELEPSSIISKSGVDGNMIGIFEMKTREFQEFSLQTILKFDSDSPCIQFKGDFGFESRVITKLKGDHFIGTPNGENLYTLFLGNKVVQSIGEFPFHNQFKGVDPRNLDLAYQYKLIKHPKKALALGTSIFSFNMDILELKNDNQLTIKKNLHFWPPEFESSTEPDKFYASIIKENKFGNVSTDVSESFIYVLYSDQAWEYQFPLKSNRVLVYDWEGKPIKILELDQEVSMIAAHEKDEFLIGYIDDGKANLYQFQMN